MRRWLGFLLTGAIVGCSAAGGGAPSVPITQPAMGPLSIKIIVPSAAFAGANARLRKAMAAAESTSGIKFSVYPHGGNPTTQALAVTGADISSASPNCTVAGTMRTCIFSLVAPVSTANDLLAQTYDVVVPANGTVPGGAHLLASGVSPNIAVVAGSTNTVSLTLDPVLSSVTLAATPNVLRTLLPASKIGIAVYGYDAAGNLILSGNYVDQYGNPVTVTLSTTANPNSSFTLTASPVTGSGMSASATYNGFANVASGSIVVASGAPYASTLSIPLVPPTVYAVSDNNLQGAPVGYQGITSLVSFTSVNILYTTPVNNGMDYVSGGSSNAGHPIPASQTPNPVATSGALPLAGGLAVNSNLILVYSGGSTISQFPYSAGVPLAPQVAATCTPSGPGSCGTTGGIAYDGGDHTIVYGSGTGVYKFTGNGSPIALPSSSPIPIPGATWGGVYFDSYLSRTWLADNQSGGKVYMYDDTAGTLTASAPLAGAPFDVTTDAVVMHGWGTLPIANKIVEFTSPLGSGAGPTTTYPTTASPQYITSDDVQQMWISETSGAGLVLGHIDIASGKYGEITLPSISGGVAGPIKYIGYGNALAIVHYSGSASPGEVLLVVP